MIVLIENGKLGNQLFQYAALKTLISKGELLCLIGFDDIKKTFDDIEAHFILPSKSALTRALILFLPKIDIFLGKIPAFRLIEEKRIGEHTTIKVNSGFINQIGYCKTNTSFFQSEQFLSSRATASIKVKPHLLNQAKDKLESLNCIHQKLIFVHIRRGDYLQWPSKENPAVIPTKWYRHCINEIKKIYHNTFLIFVSDDIPYVKDLFGEMDNSFISEGDKSEDFALMTLCDGGILSASSFAWWAAYFAKINNPEAVFLAPLYWAGHSTNQWYPPDIKSKFLQYIPVMHT